MERPLYRQIWDELAAHKAMVFLAGPRQVGKTTLARQVAAGFANRLHLNWDVVADRTSILRTPDCFTGLPRRAATRVGRWSSSTRSTSTVPGGTT